MVYALVVCGSQVVGNMACSEVDNPLQENEIPCTQEQYLDWRSWTFEQGKLVPKTEAVLQAEKQAQQRQAMLACIAEKMAETDKIIRPLELANRYDRVTEAEKVKLESLSIYLVMLSRLEKQPGFPEQIDWPVRPA